MDKNDPRLTAYVLGELSDQERANVEALITASPELQQTVAEIEELTQKLSCAFEQDLALAEPVKIELGESDPKIHQTKSRSRFLFWAAACSIALLLGSVIFLVNQQPSQFFGVDLQGGIDVADTDSTLLSEDWEGKVRRRARFKEVEIESEEDPFADSEDDAYLPSMSVIDQGDEEEPNSVAPAFAPSQSLIVSVDEDESEMAVEEFGLYGRFPATNESSDAPDGQNILLTESVNQHDRRADRVGRQFQLSDLQSQLRGELRTPMLAGKSGELMSNGQVPNRDALGNDLIEADFLETMFEAEKSATPLSEPTNEDTAGAPPAELNQRYRASFDVNQRITEAEIQLQVALQRFGPEHAAVEELKNRVTAWRRFSGSLSDNSKTIATQLLRRVEPSGTDEIEIKQLELEPTISTEDFVMRIAATATTEEGDSADRNPELDAAIEQYRAFADDPEKQAEKAKFIEAINREIRTRVGNYNKKLRQLRGWKRVKAVNNTSRLIVGDKDELDLTGMQVQVQVDGFRARVLVDYFYYNDRDQQLEGNFKIRLPDDSSLYYFAFGESAYDFSPEGPLAGNEFVDGDQYVSMAPAEIGRMRQDAWKNVKEAKVVPREKAAFAYKQTVRRRVDPALVEWSGAGIFNARVFPLTAGKLHRIVVGYDVGLTSTSDGHSYRLDLPEQTGQCRVDLSVSDYENGDWKILFDGTAEGGQNQTAQWAAGASIGDAKSQKQMRFNSPKWKSLSLLAANTKAVVLQSPKSEHGQFFATQFQAKVPKAAAAGNDRAVFLVDTSLSSQPEKFNVWLDLIKATLENNRSEIKEFAVLFFDVDCRFWRGGWTKNTKDNLSGLMKDCYQIGLEGATNLHGAILELSEADWLMDDRRRPNVFLLSDGAANWGETDLKLIQREYVSTELGSIFAYQTGLNGTAIANLHHLTGATGGAVFSVTSENEVAAASVAHKNKPWQLESLTAAGTTDLMSAGKVQWIYPGQWLTVVGRGKLDQPIKMKIRQGDVTKTISVNPEINLQSEMAERLYGQVAVGQLESLGDSVFDISAAYARHFRITGQTCSLLMLESEADYQRFKIVPEDDRFVVHSKNASVIVDRESEKQQRNLVDAKSNLTAWLKRLESIDAIEFKIPTALKLAMEEFSIEPIDSRLNCKDTTFENWNKEYVQAITDENLDATVIDAEAERRLDLSPDDSIRAHSSLVESNPGDWVVARDVAFTSMNLGRPDVAYHLLRRVVHSRPFEGSAYAALGQCLHRLGKTGMSMIFYEIALEAEFPNQSTDFKKIVAMNYGSLLRQVRDGQLESAAKEYAAARYKTLKKHQIPAKSDLIVSMMWNTDQTDVDLHVLEPSGEECFYKNTNSKSGGSITTDVTNGFGPEMYTLPNAPEGEYQIKVKFFASDQNRTKVRNKVYLSIFTNYGSDKEQVLYEMISLSKVGEKELVKTINIDK